MSRVPSKADLLAWIRDNPGASGKREIARAFGLKGADRVELKRLLRELKDEGAIRSDRRRNIRAGHLPPVTVLVALAPDADGDIFAVPKDWSGEDPPPPILYMPRKADPALARGDLFLARLRPVGREAEVRYEAQLIKRLSTGPRRVLGIYRQGAEGGRVVPVDKRARTELVIPPGAENGAREGELVEAETLPGKRLGLPRGQVVERLGDPGAPRSVSLIAIHEHGIAYEFPEEIVVEAARAEPPSPDGREDLRDMAFVTIDPADARDHDDAVAAAADPNPANPGGFILWVAIADVAWYVRAGSATDREARRRGNSTYFPDRVAPMLPERLSADLCSLHEAAERPCLAVRMVLDAQGRKTGHRFTRAVIRSAASLSYQEAQAAADGTPDERTEPLVETVIAPLFAAYRALARARDARQPLDLDLPERRIELSPEGRVLSVGFRERLEAHRVIEEAMILANVAAAETLEARKRPFLYRVHEEPNPDKLDALREIVEAVGLTLAKGQVLQTRHLNDLLHQARGSEMAELVNMAVLRAQTQAYYSPENFGHFGLNLRRYAHFTSPIRRYADLVVHRALISALGLGEGRQSPEEVERLAETAEHISQTERVSMAAERDTADRYLAAFLAERTGAEFSGTISGVAGFGIFVRLDETGADGLVPISTLGREYFHFDADSQTLTGEHSRRVIGLGQRVTVRLIEAAPVTGGLVLELLDVEGAALPRPKHGTPRAAHRRKASRAKIARAKAERRAKRKR